MPIHGQIFFRRAILAGQVVEIGQTDRTPNLDQIDLGLVCDHGSLVDLPMQDYKSLCAAVTIVPPWLTPRRTHRQTAFQPSCMNSSAS